MKLFNPRPLVCLMMVALTGFLCGSPAQARTGAPATQPTKEPAVQSPGHAAAKEEEAEHPLVAWMEITDELPENSPPLAWIDPDNAKPTLRRVLRELKRVAQDDRYTGLVIYLDEPELGLAQVDELTSAIQEVRAAKKKVLVFAEEYDLKSYLLACAGDQILLLRKGNLELSGLGVEEMYLAGLLEKVGAKADFLQVGKYKGAEEPLTRTGPSPEWNQNFDNLLDDLYHGIIERIGKARGLKAAEVEKAFADCWTMSDEQYVQRKLIDRLTDRDLVDATETVFGADFDWDDVLATDKNNQSFDNPFALLRLLLQENKPKPKRTTIAVINAFGEITSGEDGGNSDDIFGGGQSIGSRSFEETVSDIRDDQLIKGVIVRIDSPGGSALASEVIWQAIHSLAEDKPVYVSVGSMAASGGYYMATAAHEIYVSPSSIVGSIGVVGGKIVLGGLYDKIGVSVYRRSRGPLGDMFNSVEPFTPDQKAALQIAFEHTYDQFKDRVKAGRGKRIKDLSQVDQGRIFSGRQAVANGLADHIGGIEIAVADMAKELKLKPGSYDVINLPPPLTLPEYVQQLMDQFSAAPMAPDQAALMHSAQLLMGKRNWIAARSAMSGIMLLRREPVLTLMPSVIVIR